jgi:hypothetical protein
MARTARRLLTVALLGGAFALPAARSQTPAPPPASAAPAPAIQPDAAKLVDSLDLPDPLPASEVPAPAGGWEPEFLRSLPRPPDQPRSLFQPAPPLGPPPPDLERPYFQWDPILDPPQWGRPGWFGGVQFDLIHPHIQRRLVHGATDNTVTTKPNMQQVNVAIGAAPLNWTVAPRFEVGYRLPSGFGQFTVAERFFSTQGADVTLGPNGPGTRTSRLGTSYTDFDYGSREYTPWANWSMQGRVGMRLAYADIDSQFFESFAKAAAGNGVLAARQRTTTESIGPHFRVELDRRFGESGFSFVNKLDYAATFGRLHQTWAASTINPSGRPDRGILHRNPFQNIPILNYQVGLGWQPPRYPNVRFFVGYVYEAWWNTETNANANGGLGAGKGMFTDQGVVFQLGVNF